MHFTSFEFAAFFGLVLWLNWKFKAWPGGYRWFLLTANLIFYGAASVKFLPLLLVVALAAYLTAKGLARAPNTAARRTIIIIDTAFNLSLLALFKYFEFLLTAFEALISPLGWAPAFRVPEIFYPAGLSFFTFQGLSLAIDHYRDRTKKPYKLLDVVLYTSFFPTVFSGPIQRADHFIPQLGRAKYNPANFSLGYALLISGLFKKVVLSSYLSEHIVRQVFQVPSSFSAWGTLAGIYGYSAQIYLDFSGYSDIAIGLALLMGYNLSINFNSPYLALNIRDFWHRWHISLSTWLRDYLYISLGGSRRGNRYLNLMITQVLGGLWHGAHFRYIIWGFGHGLALVVSHFYQNRLKNGSRTNIQNRSPWRRRVSAGINFFLTFNFVSFMWIFFRAEDTSRAWEVIQGAVNWGRPGEGASLLVWFTVLMTLVMQLAGGPARGALVRLQNRMSTPIMALWAAFWIILILRLGPDGVLPFIYFQY